MVSVVMSRYGTVLCICACVSNTQRGTPSAAAVRSVIEAPGLAFICAGLVVGVGEGRVTGCWAVCALLSARRGQRHCVFVIASLRCSHVALMLLFHMLPLWHHRRFSLQDPCVGFTPVPRCSGGACTQSCVSPLVLLRASRHLQACHSSPMLALSLGSMGLCV